MDKDYIGEIIHITSLIWVAGILNIVFLLPQALTILKNRSVENISLLTYLLAFFIQIIGALTGWVYNIPAQMWTLIGSACISLSIIGLILFYKKR